MTNSIARFRRNRFPSIFDDSWFDEVFPNEFYMRPFAGIQARYASDVVETDGAIVVTTELPGFAKENISVTFENGDLTIRASHSDESEEEGTHVVRERSYQAYNRTIHVVNDIDVDNANVTYENGVLKVDLPKVKSEKDSKVLPISD